MTEGQEEQVAELLHDGSTEMTSALREGLNVAEHLTYLRQIVDQP